MIEGTLVLLDKRTAYYLMIMKRRFWESRIQKHETKYYFTLKEHPERLLTFVKVHRHLFDDVDNIGDRNIEDFHGNVIKARGYSRVEHTHIGRTPEYYPYDYIIRRY